MSDSEDEEIVENIQDINLNEAGAPQQIARNLFLGGEYHSHETHEHHRHETLEHHTHETHVHVANETHQHRLEVHEHHTHVTHQHHHEHNEHHHDHRHEHIHEHHVQANTALVGDVHQYYHHNNRVQADDVSHVDHQTTKLDGPTIIDKIKLIVTNLLKTLNAKVDVITGSQRSDPVPLDVLREEYNIPEDFGAGALFYRTDALVEDAVLLQVKDLLPVARENATKEAQHKCSNRAAIIDYVERFGNIVGVVGIAGIGKTTLGKQYISLIRVTSLTSGLVAYIFYVPLGGFDFTQVMNVLQFLMRATDPRWKHDQDTDEQILETLSQSDCVHIVMDGLDEARLKKSLHAAPVMHLYDRATPDVIFKNITSGNILPNAHKLLISRPGAYHDLHPDNKPHFPVRVVGLGEKSQDLLFQRTCKSPDDYLMVKRTLDLNLSAKALCFIPIFAKSIVPYILNHGSKQDVFTIADVFASFVDDCLRSSKFQRNPSVLRKLSELALHGMHRGKVLFDEYDLDEIGLNVAGLEDFINMLVSSEKVTLKILDGDKLYYFVHLLLQEFFTSLKLMFSCDLPAFAEHLANMDSDQWEMVLRFLFGLLNPRLHKNLRAVYRITPKDLASKKSLLVDLTKSQVDDFARTSVKDFPVPLASLTELEPLEIWTQFRSRLDDNRLFKLCSLANESRDAEVTACVADGLPGMFIVPKVVLPSHVASLCHVLRATKRQIVINVGVYWEPATFTGDGLKAFLETYKETPNTKITKFHVRKADGQIAIIAPLIQTLEELTMQFSNLSDRDIAILVQHLETKDTSLEVLDITGNPISKSALEHLSACLSKVLVQRIYLVRCNITPEHVQVLANNLTQIEYMDLLNLSYNAIGTRGSDWLATCVHKLHVLVLRNCDIDDVEALAEAIAKRTQTMEVLSLGQNKIGSRGVKCLAKCLHNIKWLWLYKCDIVELAPLTEAIAKREHSMTFLDVSDNPLCEGSTDLLESCRPKIKQLIYSKCSFTSAGDEALEFFPKIYYKGD